MNTRLMIETKFEDAVFNRKDLRRKSLRREDNKLLVYSVE